MRFHTQRRGEETRQDLDSKMPTQLAAVQTSLSLFVAPVILSRYGTSNSEQGEVLLGRVRVTNRETGRNNGETMKKKMQVFSSFWVSHCDLFNLG